MTLILSVTSSGNNTEHEILEHEFKESGGTIGRRMSNAWVLPDENRHLSGSHATVEYEKGHYFIVDTSTNGVFLNGNAKPVGRGVRQELEDGFQLMMGTFNISVAIKKEKEAVLVDNSAEDGGEGLFADLVDDPMNDVDSLPVQEIPAIEEMNEIPAEVGSDDPFFEFGEFTSSDDDSMDNSHLNEDKVVESNIPELGSFFKPAEIKSNPQDSSPVGIPEITGNLKESIDPFTKEVEQEQSSSMIPDDWGEKPSEDDAFDDLFSGIDDPFTEKADPFALTEINDFSKVKAPLLDEKKEEKVVNVMPPPRRKKEDSNKEQSVRNEKPASGNTDESYFSTNSSALPSGSASAFLKGLGVDETLFGVGFSEQELFLAGKLFRTALQGTMEVLQSRAEIKNEMRMDMTTIQPIQNNPIKFAVNVDEALKKMFLQENTSYMDPEQAMNEAFDDIKSHQIAVISGIQASLVSVLKRFEPENLVERLEKESPISANIPIHRKAKLWDKFESLYDTIESEAEDDFNRLFGQEFAKAYDEQVAQLEKQRGE